MTTVSAAHLVAVLVPLEAGLPHLSALLAPPPPEPLPQATVLHRSQLPVSSFDLSIGPRRLRLTCWRTDIATPRERAFHVLSVVSSAGTNAHELGSRLDRVVLCATQAEFALMRWMNDRGEDIAASPATVAVRLLRPKEGGAEGKGHKDKEGKEDKEDKQGKQQHEHEEQQDDDDDTPCGAILDLRGAIIDFLAHLYHWMWPHAETKEAERAIATMCRSVSDFHIAMVLVLARALVEKAVGSAVLPSVSVWHGILYAIVHEQLIAPTLPPPPPAPRRRKRRRGVRLTSTKKLKPMITSPRSPSAPSVLFSPFY